MVIIILLTGNQTPSCWRLGTQCLLISWCWSNIIPTSRSSHGHPGKELKTQQVPIPARINTLMKTVGGWGFQNLRGGSQKFRLRDSKIRSLGSNGRICQQWDFPGSRGNKRVSFGDIFCKEATVQHHQHLKLKSALNVPYLNHWNSWRPTLNNWPLSWWASCHVNYSTQMRKWGSIRAPKSLTQFLQRLGGRVHCLSPVVSLQIISPDLVFSKKEAVRCVSENRPSSIMAGVQTIHERKTQLGLRLPCWRLPRTETSQLSSEWLCSKGKRHTRHWLGLLCSHAQITFKPMDKQELGASPLAVKINICFVKGVRAQPSPTQALELVRLSLLQAPSRGPGCQGPVQHPTLTSTYSLMYSTNAYGIPLCDRHWDRCGHECENS